MGPASGIGAILFAIATIGVAKGLFIAPNRHRVMESAPEGKMGSVNGGPGDDDPRRRRLWYLCVRDGLLELSADRGASYLHAPDAVLEHAFRAAFLLGLAVSVVGIVTAGLKIKQAAGGRESPARS